MSEKCPICGAKESHTYRDWFHPDGTMTRYKCGAVYNIGTRDIIYRCGTRWDAVAPDKSALYDRVAELEAELAALQRSEAALNALAKLLEADGMITLEDNEYACAIVIYGYGAKRLGKGDTLKEAALDAAGLVEGGKE